MRLAGVTFGLAVGLASALIFFLAGLNVWYFLRQSGETPQLNLFAGIFFAAVGVALAGAGWFAGRRL
jgi:hypothetical protein